MEPFARNKAEGAKKVIVAANNSINNVLRARPSKGSASPRHSKTRAAKTNNYSGTHNHNVNGSVMNLSWPSLGSQLSLGNASPEKSPLGHYRPGNSFDSSCTGLQLNSSNFLANSSVAKFNATLFSSAASHSSQGFDVEEAMDIDHQDVPDEPVCSSSTCDSTLELSEELAPPHERPGVSEHKNHTDEYLASRKSNSNASSTKQKVNKLVRVFLIY